MCFRNEHIMEKNLVDCCYRDFYHNIVKLSLGLRYVGVLSVLTGCLTGGHFEYTFTASGGCML